MKKKILMSLFTIAIIGALITGGVVAVFTDTDNSNPNNFNSGTLIINLKDGTKTWYGIYQNMKPGDIVKLKIQAESKGTLPLDYTVTATLSGDLSHQHGGTIGLGCSVIWLSIDGGPQWANPANWNGSLSALLGGDPIDNILIAIQLDSSAGNHYQGQSGTISVTVNATQQ